MLCALQETGVSRPLDRVKNEPQLNSFHIINVTCVCVCVYCVLCGAAMTRNKIKIEVLYFGSDFRMIKTCALPNTGRTA